MDFDSPINRGELIHQVTTFMTPMLSIGPLLPEFREIIHTSIQVNFNVGGRYGNDNPFGGGRHAWIPSKRAVHQAGSTLVDTAQLAGSITVTYAGPESLAVSSNKVYALIHQFGGKAGRNLSTTIVARPYAVIQNEDLQDMTDAALEYYSRRFS